MSTRPSSRAPRIASAAPGIAGDALGSRADSLALGHGAERRRNGEGEAGRDHGPLGHAGRHGAGSGGFLRVHRREQAGGCDQGENCVELLHHASASSRPIKHVSSALKRSRPEGRGRRLWRAWGRVADRGPTVAEVCRPGRRSSLALGASAGCAADVDAWRRSVYVTPTPRRGRARANRRAHGDRRDGHRRAHARRAPRRPDR